MADWTIGTGGTMRITDTGTYVEFWLNSNNSTTFAHELPWGYTVNGTTDNSNTYDYSAGAGWERLGRWLVTTDQTVTFRLFDTGTGRFGSGESHSLAINRASVPPAPTLATVTPAATSAYVNLNSNGNGGLTVDQWQIGYGKSSTATQLYANASLADGTVTITGLDKGTQYYFWGRGHNSKGWGPWSARVAAKTWIEPSPPSAVVISNVKQTSLSTKFTVNANGGTAITLNELGYGTNPTAPSTIIASDGTDDLTGLAPGAKYYFWARSKNAVGYSLWSAVSSVTLPAGVRYKVDGVWKTAVPYVRHEGVWRPAKPYVKIGGLWKETG